MIFLLVIHFDYPVRISFLCTLITDYCGSISLDGKWMLNTLALNKAQPPRNVSLIWTDFPFWRITIDLPKPVLGTVYSVKDPCIWSPSKNAFIMNPVSNLGESVYELEIVQINPDGTTKVSTYSEPDKKQWLPLGMYNWSVQGDRVVFYHMLDDNTLRVTVLNLDAEVVKTFDFHEEGSAGWEENPNIILDDSTIFLAFYPIPKDSVLNRTSTIERTKIYSIPIENPKNSELLMDEPGYYGLFSYNRDNNGLMIFKFIDKFRETDQVKILDVKSHKIIEEISIRRFADSQAEIDSYGGICLNNNCIKVAANSHYSKTFIVLIWDWKAHQFSYYPNKYKISEVNHPLDGFLCVNESLLKYKITWFDVCN